MNSITSEIWGFFEAFGRKKGFNGFEYWKSLSVGIFLHPTCCIGLGLDCGILVQVQEPNLRWICLRWPSISSEIRVFEAFERKKCILSWATFACFSKENPLHWLNFRACSHQVLPVFRSCMRASNFSGNKKLERNDTVVVVHSWQLLGLVIQTWELIYSILLSLKNVALSAFFLSNFFPVIWCFA